MDKGYSERIVFTNNELGRRHFKEILGNLLVSLILSPTEVWLVTPWISDFDLLDNRAGVWNAVEPAWGERQLSFSDLLIRGIESGCKLNLVSTEDIRNEAFINRLRTAVLDKVDFNLVFSNDLHVKGLLTKDFFLSGSMNFTYSGAHKNEEQIQLSSRTDTILEAKLEFENQYG